MMQPLPPPPAARWAVGVVMWGDAAGASSNEAGYYADQQTGAIQVAARVNGTAFQLPANDPKVAVEFAALRQAIEAIDHANLPAPTRPSDPATQTVTVGVASDPSYMPGFLAYPLADAPQSFRDALTAAQALGARIAA